MTKSTVRASRVESTTIFQAPAPAFAEHRIITLLREQFGLACESVRSLPSERDQNTLVLAAGRPLVLKISNAQEDPAVLAMELAAMQHLSRTTPDLPIPQVIATTGGRPLSTLVDGAGRSHLVRVITVVPGQHAEGLPMSVAFAGSLGQLCARTQVGLQGFFHPAAGRELDWDIRRLATVVDEAPRGQDAGSYLLRQTAARVAGALKATAALPAGVHHADVTLTNVLAGPDASITGLIDFGDMHHTAFVCDLVASLTSLLRNTAADASPDTWQLAAAFLNGYQRHRLLLPAEAALLGELVLARLTATLAISATRSPAHPGNSAYINQYDRTSWALLRELADIPALELRHRFARLSGTAGAPTSREDARPPRLWTRRQTVMAGSLSPLFYRQALEIVRGEGVWLFDAEGRRYLDGYNNVAVVGHSHPVVTQAITRQLAVLNTHSRYLHPNVVELAERLVATMPGGLDTCLFTTSGTEANELAWRMAIEYTGGDAAIVAEHAYHGTSKQMADLSSNEWPEGYRPTDVATFEAPTGPAERLTHDRAVGRITRAADDLAAQGRRPAMVLVDTMFTTEGIRGATPAFMTGLLDSAHTHGALFVADEVQAGFGRTGPALWRFKAFGITPDVVTLGKPMGAGYPIGALITRREIADALARRYEYFSTFAGNAVAAAAGLAVLDVLTDGDIPANAVDVGDYLRGNLGRLRATHPVIGEVRGFGLIAGVDLIPPTGDARAFAKDVLEGLRDRGVLAGSTGPRGGVLKVRPPLVWQREHADLFVDTLDQVLTALA